MIRQRFDDDGLDEMTIAVRRADDRAFLVLVRELRDAADLEALLDLELTTSAAVDAAQAEGFYGPDWRLVAIERAFAFVIGVDMHAETDALEGAEHG